MICSGRFTGLVAASFVLGCGFAATGQAQVDTSHLGPAEYRSHFEPNPGASKDSGSRDGWESFPISQEVGYDPTIQPESSKGGSVLTREMAPTRGGLFQLGFIRRLHIVANASSSIHFRLRAPYLNKSTALHISIFRGENEESHQAKLDDSSWQQINVPINASPEFITAIAIAVDLPQAIQGRPERVEIADIRVKAMATRRIVLREPQALWDASRELYYLQSCLHPGEELFLKAEVDKATNVRWRLISPSGELVAEGKGVVLQHRFSSAAAPGIWTVHIADERAEATALLLVRPLQKTGLLFDHAPKISGKLLESIRERKAVLENTATPEAGMNVASMDTHWLLAGLPSYFSIVLQPTELAMLDAMEYRATGDPKALEQSRKLLESIARWPMWVHPWFPAHGYHSYYPVGIMTKYIVSAEEFLGDDLSKEGRSKLDRSLMELSVKPIYEEYVLEDRLQFNTSNWIGNTVGGALLAALQSEDPNAAGYALGLFIKERDHVSAAYTLDGSYGEGITYHRFDLEMTTLVAEAAKRLLGTSIDKPLLGGDRYMRYAAYGKDGVLDYGDSHVDITPSNVFAYVAAQNQSSSVTDFYFKYRAEGTAEILSRVLWESSIKPAAPPVAEPASTVFKDRGIAVLRDNWNPDSTVIAMRAGKNFNHNHADEGSLFYAHSGTLWLGEAGYADYYKDPSYPTFNIQAIGHNTLLVDGDEQSQILPGNAVFGMSPSITHSLIGESASLVQADLTSAYNGTLQRYTRSLFYQTNGPLIVIDDVRSDQPHRFSQVWHPKHKIAAFDPSSNAFTMTDGREQVEVKAFGTSDISTNEIPSPLPLVSYEKAEHELIERPMRFEASTLKPSRTATIMTIIMPKEDRSGTQLAPVWEETPESATLRVGDSGVCVDYETWKSQAVIARPVFAWWRGGGLLINGTRYEDQTLDEAISADHPIDMSLTREKDGVVNVEIDALNATSLELHNLKTVKGASCNAATGPNKCLHPTIAIASGHSSLQLRHSTEKMQ